MGIIPYQFTAKSVFRYIHVLEQVVDLDPPRRIQFVPTATNSETAVSRLRDAVRAFSLGHVTHLSIDPTLLTERFRHYVVTHDGTTVSVTPKAEKKQHRDEAVVVTSSTDQHITGDILAVIKTDDPQFTVICEAFALLLGRQILRGRLHIVGPLNNELLLDKLALQHDIAIVQNPDSTFYMF